MKKLITDAVFEGGGVKGIGLAGAAAVVEERGYQWSNLAGTSAGAITAALIAAGYTAAELKLILSDLDYNKFRDPGVVDKIPFVGSLLSLIFEKGIYEGKFLEDWIRERLRQKGIKTFGDLVIDEFKDNEQFRFKLRVIASDISRGKMLALPQDVADYGMRPEDLDVARAVRMSMSIPFYYEPARVLHQKEKQNIYIVDGGVLSNFPLWIFDSEGIPDWPTFGFKLVEPAERLPIPHKIKGPISLLWALFSTMSGAHDARYVQDEQYVRTIAIPTLGVGITEFDLSRERSEALYQSGRKAAEKFLSTWDFERYVKEFRTGKPPVSRRESLWKRMATSN